MTNTQTNAPKKDVKAPAAPNDKMSSGACGTKTEKSKSGGCGC